MSANLYKLTYEDIPVGGSSDFYGWLTDCFLHGDCTDRLYITADKGEWNSLPDRYKKLGKKQQKEFKEDYTALMRYLKKQKDTQADFLVVW